MTFTSIEETRSAIEAHTRGDSTAICEIAARIARGLCRWLGIRDTEDLQQEAVLLVLRNLKNYTEQPDWNPYNYLTTIILNMIKLEYRKEKNQKCLEHRLAKEQNGGKEVRWCPVLFTERPTEEW